MDAVEPRITPGPGYCLVEWEYPSTTVRFEASHFRSHTGGALDARVRIDARNGDGKERRLHLAQLNLSAPNSRGSLAKSLRERFPSDKVDWLSVVEESCMAVLEVQEEGEPIERLEEVEHLEPEYIHDPLILDHETSLWFAPGASGKSYTALLFALLVQNGLPFNGVSILQRNVLFLDYETSKQEVGRRTTLLANGLRQTHIGTPLDFPAYRRCLRPLADETTTLVRSVVEHEIGLVIVDSAGPACGGNIRDEEMALRYFAALREITAGRQASSITQTHTNKTDRREESASRLPIGSVYWENMPRAVWEIRPRETAYKNVLQVGMFARKHNMARPEPVGVTFTFERGAVSAGPSTAKDVTTEEGATRDLILAELSAGQATIAELETATGANASTIRWHLKKLADSGQAERVDRGVYRLAEDRP